MMKTSTIAIVAALTAFAGTAVAQDQNSTTSQPLKPPAATTEPSTGTDMNTGADTGMSTDTGTSTMDAAPAAGDTAQTPPAEEPATTTAETPAPATDTTTTTTTAETPPPVSDTTTTTTTAETPAPATDTEMVATTSAEPFIQMQEEGQILGSDLMGADVVSAADEDIGDVKDVLMSQDGQAIGILVGVGGFLGIGEKDVAIPFERLTIVREEAGENEFQVTLETTREELESAPAFTRLEETQDAMTGATTEGVAPAPIEGETGAAVEGEGDMITPETTTTTPPAAQ